MKTVSPVVSRNPVDPRSSEAIDSKFEPITELAQDLCNEMTVINLCKTHLTCLLLDVGDSGIAQALDALERAAKNATQIAKPLPDLILKPYSMPTPRRCSASDISHF